MKLQFNRRRRLIAGILSMIVLAGLTACSLAAGQPTATLFPTVSVTDTPVVVLPSATSEPTTIPTPTPEPTTVQPPVVQIIEPASGVQVETGQQINIQASATSGIGIARVVMSVDGALFTSIPNPNPASQSFTLSQAWSSEAVGSHVIGLRAFDSLGNASSPAEITVQVLSPPAPPQVWFAQPISTTGVILVQPGTQVTVDYWSSSQAGLQRMELWSDGQVYGTVSDPNQPNLLHGQQIWSTDDLGEHALFIRAYDRSGQSTQSSTLTVRVVKNVAPEVTLLNISAGDQIQSGQTIPVAIQASASQGVTLIQLFIDGKLYSSWESANPAGVSEITVSLEWKSPSLGRHVIHITAEDKVGNSTTTQSIRVTIVKAQATPTQTSKPTATRTAKPGTPTPTKKPTRTPTGKPTTAIPPTATHTPVASTEPTHVPTLPATVTSSSTPTRTPPPTTPPTTEPSAIPTASATPSATSQATTEPTAIPAATDTPIPVGPDQLIGKWSGTAQPSGDRWDMEFISSDSGISGTLALQPQSGEVLTGTLTSVALQGDEVRLTASFPSPGAEVAPKAASTARALSFINFNGKINSDGQLAGEWQGSDGSRGTVTLDRVEAVRLAAPLANPKVAGATPQAQQPVQNQNGLQNTTQNNPQNTPQNYLVPGLALAGALIVILAGIWFLRRRRRL